MAKCPKCGTEIEKPNKEWILQPQSGPQSVSCAIKIKHYVCSQCKKSFRIGESTLEGTTD